MPARQPSAVHPMRDRLFQEFLKRDAIGPHEEAAMRFEGRGKRRYPAVRLRRAALFTSMAVTRRPAFTMKSTSSLRSRQ